MTAGTVAGDAGMVEIGRYPGIGRMASQTVFCCRDMACVLAGCCRPIVTTATGTDHIGMIHSEYRYPGGIAVAVLTDIGRLNVSGMFAGGRGAVMATDAVTCDSGMIEIRRYPAVGGMAGLTVITALNMCSMLANGDTAVVTAEAGTDHFVMIHTNRWYPGSVTVTALTDIGGLDMGRMLAGRGGTVMTT